MKDFAEKFYHSKQWLKCRSSYISERIRIDGGLCELCGLQLGYIVHHKITLTHENIVDADVSLNHNNLQYVCHTCHNKIDHFGSGSETSQPRCGFGPDGQPFILPCPPKN